MTLWSVALYYRDGVYSSDLECNDKLQFSMISHLTHINTILNIAQWSFLENVSNIDFQRKSSQSYIGLCS